MTPEELREALQQRGMVQAVAEVSGYSDSHIKELKSGRSQFAKHTAKILIDSLPRAREIVQAKREAVIYDGKPCVKCAETLRYVNGGRCVRCNSARGGAWRPAK